MNIDMWLPILESLAGSDLGERGVERLSKGFTGHRRLIGAKYLDQEGLSSAYLRYYWPISYMQARQVLGDVFTRFLCTPKRILDCGSGPGPFAFAARDYLESCGLEKPESILLDHSKVALEQAQALASARGLDSASFSTRLWDPTKIDTRESGFFGVLEPDYKVDLVLFGHSLNEFWKGSDGGFEKRVALLQATLELLAPGGMVLVLEPALHEQSTQLLQLRDALALQGRKILGPCLWQGPCPALAQNQVCHAELRAALPAPLLRQAREAGLQKTKSAMSCLAIAGASPPAARLEAQNLFRVTSEALLNKAGRTRYRICGLQGLTSFSAKLGGLGMEASSTAEFAKLLRGDCIELQNVEVREGGLGLASETSIRHVGS